jgi:glycosyltransferase involved in cell wall biosynthesis
MPKEPFFSVIIPTRNRAHLLRHALQSALYQTFEDYEIVVSDNCSQDDTAQVVKELGASRVRYVKPDSTLAMPDHWEFALEQARGEYVTYLCDDDAWSPKAMQRAADAIALHKTKLAVLCSANYFSSNWFDAASRNVVTITPHTGGEREYDSKETINNLFTCRILMEAPRMLNSFCERETLLRVRAEAGRLFLMCPDYSFAAFILTEIPTWIYLDEPLHLQGVFAEGIGSTHYYNRGEPAREFVREFKESKLLNHVPLEAPVVTNYIAETLMLSKERMASKLADYEIDWEQYFINCWQDISRHEQNGVNVDADKREFLNVLSEQPDDVQASVRAVIEANAAVAAAAAVRPPVRQNPIKKLARKIINSSSLLTNSEAFIRRRETIQQSPTESIMIRGEEAGFSNILECAERLPSLAKRARAQATATSGVGT